MVRRTSKTASKTTHKTAFAYIGLLLFALFSFVGAYTLADSYIDRLPDHRGFHLVAVDNQVTNPPETRPERVLLVVVDGLRQDSARTMRSTRRLQELGQCRPTHTGPLTISRPVYTVISTGLEQDRTGSRNNDDTSPVAVESIWGVAHAAGLVVHAASNLRWWEELFPGAFDSYNFDLDETQNFFRLDEQSELYLLHPVRVDTAGHSFGADSAEYRAAVATVDTELEALMNRLDFERDLLILTADHGHSAAGGHGGPADEIATVLTCFAGLGIQKRANGKASDSRVIAPTISVVLGLPFPKHMRAGDDNLDQIWTIVDSDRLGHTYVRERKENIEQFRRANAQAAGALLGTDSGRWSHVYAQGTRRHQWSWMVVAIALVGVVLLIGRVRKQTLPRGAATVLWVTLSVASACLVYTWLRGSFDFTSINKRQEFLNASLGASLGALIAMNIGHVAVFRSLRTLLLDNTTQLIVLVVVSVAHPLIYGFTLGFPLPGRIAIFLPFILGALVISSSIVVATLTALILLRALRASLLKAG